MRPILTLITLLIFHCSYSQTLVPVDNGSKVHFVIKNFGISTGGDLNGLEGEIAFNPNQLSQSFFNVTVKSATVDTDNEPRDKSLREDYFESAKYPHLRLVSTKIDKTNKSNEGYYYFTGNLIIKGITKSIAFLFKVESKNNGYLFTGDFAINRLQYNVGESSTVLGNNVKVSLKVMAVKK